MHRCIFKCKGIRIYMKMHISKSHTLFCYCQFSTCPIKPSLKISFNKKIIHAHKKKKLNSAEENTIQSKSSLITAPSTSTTILTSRWIPLIEFIDIYICVLIYILLKTFKLQMIYENILVLKQSIQIKKISPSEHLNYHL